MTLKKILFVCIHNSARSQMAEAFINQFAHEKLIAESEVTVFFETIRCLSEDLLQLGVILSQIDALFVMKRIGSER